MWIYKITNIQNNKIYIGQTIRPVKNRFHRHINDALNNNLDTHFARAIRKYGKDNFIIETIDEATNQIELNQKEQYWIQHYNSVQNGYNETDAINKCGGNTYQSKTIEEMNIIKEKLRVSKMGGKNPNARKVKMIDLVNNIEIIFNSQQECANYLNLSSHMPISRRCRGYTKSPLNNQYQLLNLFH